MANATSVTFFDSGPLPSGKHTLKVMVASATAETPFYLDYIAVAQANASATSGTLTPVAPVESHSVTATGSGGTASSTASSQQGGSAAGEDIAQLDPRKLAAIVGGIIGGLGVLAVVGIVAWTLCLRRRRRGSNRYCYSSFSSAAMVYDGASSLAVLILSILGVTSHCNFLQDEASGT